MCDGSGCSSHTNCNVASANPSVQQTLSEMEWERSLWNAAFSGETEKVQKIINKTKNLKFVVNAEDKSGYTPLHYAARGGHVDICKILVQNGALVDVLTKSGRATPLHKAVVAGHVPTVKFLLDSGADARIRDADGKTVIHKAVEKGHCSLLDMLLAAYPRTKEGYAALLKLTGHKPSSQSQ